MDENVKLTWLKRLLIVKMLVVALLWGLPLWLAPAGILRLLGEGLPNPPLYMRIFGATQIGLVFLYWQAYRDPVRNRDIIRYAVVDNSIGFFTLIIYGLTIRLTDPLVWFSAFLLLFFAVAFYLLMPARSGAAAPAARAA